MKKNLTLSVILVIGLLAFISSCVKDTFTEQDAYSEQRKNELLQDSIAKSKLEMEASLTQEQILLLDSLKKVGGVINYSVAAVIASDASWWSNYFGYFYDDKGEKGLEGASITIAQHGRVFTVTTDASGIGSFKDLRIGTANVNIRMAGYTEVDYVVDLPPLTETMQALDTFTLDVYNLVRHVATMVPVFSLTNNLSTISGIATVESDLTNDEVEVAADVQIKGIIDVDDENFWIRYIYEPEILPFKGLSPDSKSVEYYGKIKQIAFHSTISTATTGADGSFSLQVPSTPQGLPIRLQYDEFALDQTLLQATKNFVPVWGEQSIRTLFGYGMPVSTVQTIGTSNNQVQSAYVEFSDPTGSAAAQPSEEATATAVLTSSGIVSVTITDPGEGYTQPPVVRIPIGSAFNSVQAEGTAVITDGKVSSVTITDPGSGYAPDDFTNIRFGEAIAKKANFKPEFTFSVIEIKNLDAGSGYTQTPPDVTIVGSGTGATAHAVMAARLDEITVTAPGSGYTQAPLITISDNFGAATEATASMTLNNPLFSIAYDGTNPDELWPVAPIPTAEVVGDGAGATASVTMSNIGKVLYAGSIVGGSGYTSAPEVTISGGGGFGATAYATLVGDAVDTVIVDDPGQGYTSIPTITFTGGEGSGASSTAVLGFPVQSITMTAPGVGYNNVTDDGVTAINISNGTKTVNYLDWCDVKYDMGVRSIAASPDGTYSGVPTITIIPRDGNGSGATAVATVWWRINDIVLDAMGSGYKMDNENNVYVIIDPPTTPNGVQATAEARLGNGILAAVTPVDFGEGYLAPPNVIVMNDGDEGKGKAPVRQAELTATVSNGTVTGLTITDPGEGYDYDSYTDGAYYIDITTFNKEAAASAVANPESGQVDYIIVTNPGAGYSVVPTVEIYNNKDTADANMFGTGAAATAIVTDGRVSAIDVTNSGSGYYVTPDVRITVASSVMKAMAKCIVTADGRITGVDFTGGYPGYQFTKGYGYNEVPTVTFFPSVSGKGSGAEGVAILLNGSIDNVVMTNQGSGYTGRNKPLGQGFSITPNNSVMATAGKSYVRDIYFGTGKRTIEQ